jgi:hypothetical protein
MFNVSIREYISVLNVSIVCIRNTARSKSIPLLCTHVDSYKFSTVHPPSGVPLVPMVFWAKEKTPWHDEILIKLFQQLKPTIGHDFHQMTIRGIKRGTLYEGVTKGLIRPYSKRR